MPWQSSLAFSPDGRQVAYGDPGGNHVILWDIESGQEQSKRVEAVNDLVFSPDGGRLAIGSGDYDSGGITLLDMTGKGMSRVWNSDERVSSLAYSAHGKWLASASGNSIHIREAGTGKEIEVLHWGDVGISEILFSADGRFLIAGGGSRAENVQTVRVWKIHERRSPAVQDSTEFEELRTFRITRNIEAMAVSPDGELLAIAYGILERDPAIYIYRLPGGELVATLRGHKHPINCLAFSPDGHLLASGSYDGTTRLWDVPLPGPSPDSD